MNLIKIDDTKYHKVCAIGDVHGNFRGLSYQIQSFLFENTVFIVCGDCGLGFHKYQAYEDEFNKLSYNLKEHNNLILFVRGNHDDPSYFSEEKIQMECFRTIKDYSIVQYKDKNILCVGGGISIDRKWRIQRDIVKNIHKTDKKDYQLSYWEDEQIVYNENALQELIDSRIKIDTVITHSCPSVVPPFNKDNIAEWLKIDTELEKDINEERNILDRILDVLERHFRIKDWYYGHFHTFEGSNNAYNNVYHNINFHMIKMLEVNSHFVFYYIVNEEENAKDVNYKEITSSLEPVNLRRGGEHPIVEFDA